MAVAGVATSKSGGGAVLAVLPAGDSAFEGCETAIDGGDDVSEAVDSDGRCHGAEEKA